MQRSDVIAGTLLVLLGLISIFAIVPDQISGDSDYGIAPDVFPLTLLWLMTILSACLVISRLVKWSTLKTQTIMSQTDWVFVIGSTVFMVLSYVLIEQLGFRWGGPIVLGILLLITNELRESKLRSVLVAFITPAALFYLFWNVFRIPLP